MSNLGYAQNSQVVEQRHNALLDLHNRLNSLNNTQSELVSEIANKLHDVLNKRASESKSNEVTQPALSDYFSKMQKELDIVSCNNCRLEDILKHLNEII